MGAWLVLHCCRLDEDYCEAFEREIMQLKAPVAGQSEIWGV